MGAAYLLLRSFTLIVWFVLGYIVEVKEGNSIEILVLSTILYVNWQGQEDNN